MSVAPPVGWWRRFSYHFVLILASETAAKWLLLGGAGVISGITYGLEYALVRYQKLPRHALILMPVFSALLGLTVLLAATLFFNKKNLLQRTGFRRAFPVRAYDKPAVAYSVRHLNLAILEIRRIIRETPSAETCRLLLVSGFFYLGAPNMAGSPGHFLEDIRLPDKVRVLLLNPFPEVCQPSWAKLRASEAGHGEEVEEYLRGIKRVAEHLIALRRDEGRDIKVGFYNSWPSWQLFLNTREGIVQPVAVGRHSQHNPLYHFQYTSGSLFVPFQHHFEVLWGEWEEHLDAHRRFYEQHAIIVPRGKGKNRIIR